METRRILLEIRTASVASMLSVITRLSSSEDPTLATAPPERTPWVT